MRMTLLIEAMAALQDGKNGVAATIARHLRGHSPSAGERLRGPPPERRRGAASPVPSRLCCRPPIAVIPLASTPSADSILHDVFGYSAFRGAQAEIVSHVIDGGDALVLMPTGGGKSLCYQV